VRWKKYGTVAAAVLGCFGNVIPRDGLADAALDLFADARGDTRRLHAQPIESAVLGVREHDGEMPRTVNLGRATPMPPSESQVTAFDLG